MQLLVAVRKFNDGHCAPLINCDIGTPPPIIVPPVPLGIIAAVIAAAVVSCGVAAVVLSISLALCIMAAPVGVVVTVGVP